MDDYVVESTPHYRGKERKARKRKPKRDVRPCPTCGFALSKQERETRCHTCDRFACLLCKPDGQTECWRCAGRPEPAGAGYRP